MYNGIIQYYGITTLDDKCQLIHRRDNDLVNKYEIIEPYVSPTLHETFE